MKKCIIILVLIFSSDAFLFSQDLKIMAWNIFMVPPAVYKSCQIQRAYLIADYIKKVNPDVLVLEESFMNSVRIILKSKLDEVYKYQSDIKKSGLIKMNSGVWILSKYPIDKQDFISYKKKKGTDIFAKKGATFVEIKVNDKKLQLIGTHTQSLIKYKKTRAIQFRQIRKTIADKYYKDSICQFIIGDLNCNYYDTVEYNNMLELLDVNPSSYSGEKYSWNGLGNDLAFKFSEHSLETLDYILLRKKHHAFAEINSTEILKPDMDSCYCNQKFKALSDHNPIISTVRLK